MNSRVRRTVTILRALIAEARAERITFLAASIAYHAFISLLPLLLLLLLILTAVGADPIERNLLALVEGALTPGAAGVLLAELRAAGRSTGLSILGAVVLLWGTLRIFRGLDTAFSDIYETGGRNTFVDRLGDGVIVLGCVAGAIIVSATIDATVTGAVGGALGWWLRRVLFVCGLSAALLPIYYVFPDERNLRVREVLPGVAFAAVGLTVFESLFGLYIRFSSQSPEASTLGAILVFLTWLYFSSLVVLLGVVVNAVLAGRSHDADLKPVFDVPRSASDGRDAELVETIRRLESLPGAGSVTVVVDGEEITVPPPDEVRVQASRRSVDLLGENPSITLRWARRGDGD
jgi:membrane protein